MNKSLEALKKEFEEKQKRNGLFTDSRWNDTAPPTVIGYSKSTYEERLEATKSLMLFIYKQGFLTQEEYEKELDKEIKKVKQEYGIKD